MNLCRALILVVNLASGHAWTQTSPAQILTLEEMQRVLALGPWPPSTHVDRSNRVSGIPMAIELGRRLFRDPRLSPVGYISCVTCHQPDRAFTDKKARGHGLADLMRNTPTLVNLSRQTWYGWGGSSDSLWMASIRPLLDSREFDSSEAHVARVFVRDPELGACYRKAFKESPGLNKQRTMVNVGKALAAYQETLVTGRTPFDDFRDALNRNEATPTPKFSIAAQRGLKLFVGSAGCVSCHNGPNFSDGSFHAVPMAPLPIGVLSEDTGRLEGATSLSGNRLNLMGRFNDDIGRANAAATRKLVVTEQLRGMFRTPGLRNVTATGPYMHNGQVERLQDAIAHRSQLRVAPLIVGKDTLTAQDVDNLYAFLLTLEDAYGERRPFSNTPLAQCP